MRTFALLFSIVFLLISCEKESGTELSNSKDIQTSLKGVKPDTPNDNAVVVRRDGSFGYIIYDSKSDLTAYIGFDILELCYGYYPPYDLPFDVFTMQDIILEFGEDWYRIIRLVNDEATVMVFEGELNSCPESDAVPLWEGTASIIYTDNDVTWSGQGFNSFGMAVIADGLSINFRVVVDPELGDLDLALVSYTKIKVK